MRIIRTEMYFDEADVRGFNGIRPRGRGYDEKNPGVAFAWFRTDVFVGARDVNNLKAFRALRPREDQWPTREDVPGILDLFVRDMDDRAFLRIPTGPSLENGAIVDYILDQELVLERSPPFSISLKGVLNTANTPLWIGTLVGVGAAAPWDHPVLLMLTVPGGIIAVSSASGVGRAMEAGLNKAMKRLFDGAP